MPLVDNLDKIAFAASVEIDKLWPEKITGSFSAGASSSPGLTGKVTKSTVSHTRGANTLPFMEFSTDNSTWFNAGDMKYGTGFIDPQFSATCYTINNAVVIVAQNYTGGSVTCYYRVRLISEY